jgi:Abnormal spindle-like microcephaly-assoc'd, ASPM-SPD-2-Hydin
MVHYVIVRPRKISDAVAFLSLDVLYVAILVVLLIARQAHWFWIDRIHNPIGGIIPLGVPWFGALGAVTISIYGVVDHSSEWQAKWNLWHVIRPVVGAILGTVAYLIFVGLIQATGTTPSAVGSSSSVKVITYLVIAFVVGFREQTFRTLITRVVDILLSPGDTQKAPTVSISPSPVDFGSLPTGQTGTSVVTVANTGGAALVVQGASANPPGTVVTGTGFALSNDAVTGATINPGSSALLTVSFTPQAANPHQGTLTINCNAGTFPVSLTGTGT